MGGGCLCSRWVPVILLCSDGDKMGHVFRRVAGGSAGNGFAPRDRYAGLCERMRGKCGKFFPREGEEITAGPAIRVGPSGYIRQRAGQDGHEKQSPMQFFTASTVVVIVACGY